MFDYAPGVPATPLQSEKPTAQRAVIFIRAVSDLNSMSLEVAGDFLQYQ